MILKIKLDIIIEKLKILLQKSRYFISISITDQYGNYKVDEVDVYLNGINTQGENIADNGGIKQAFHVGR